TNVFTIVDIFTILVLSTFLCFIAALTYKYTHEGISYSPSFVHTTIMFGVLVSAIMLIIGSNIARAFALVGTLSIIRFRNAIKDTRDVGFIFFMMTIGMAVGTRFFSLAVILTFFVCLLIIALKWFNFASKKNDEEQLLKIVTPAGMDYEKEFEKIFSTYLTKWNAINIEDIEGIEKNEITYMVRFKKTAGEKKSAFIHDLKKLNKDNRVSLFGTEHLVY
ncbi:MAG: DUF4956 domain-containing protein, partial [Nanoarchaeota archaeon]